MDAMLMFLWNPPTRCTCSQRGRQESSWSFYNVALTDCLSDENFDTTGAGSLALEGARLWERWNRGWSRWNMHDWIYTSSYYCRAVFWEIMDGCDSCEVAQFNTSVIPCLTGAEHIRMWMLISNLFVVFFVSVKLMNSTHRTYQQKKCSKHFDNRTIVLVRFKQKCQTFAGSTLLDVIILCFSLSYMKVNWISFGLWVKQYKTFEDITLGCGKL